MGGVKRFQDLIAWQRGMDLAIETHHATALLPDSERFGLVSQMRRSSLSIPSNIAEGFGRESTNDLLRYLRMSRGSLFELQTQYHLVSALRLMPGERVPAELLLECDRVIQGLIRSLENRRS